MNTIKFSRNILAAVFIFFIFSVLTIRGAYAAVYSSKNGKHTVEVKSDFSPDAKEAHYKVKDANGKIVSEFKTDLSPITMILLDNGERIIGFYGSVGQTVVITQLRFYNMQGKLIKKHRMIATGCGGQDISDSGKYYAYSWWNDKKSGINLFDTQTGEILWSKSYEKLLKGVKISGDGQWIVMKFAKGKTNEIQLLDTTGALKWSGSINTRNKCAITSINKDGSVFEVTENKMIYNEKDGYTHITGVKKTIYANNKGEVEIIKTIALPQKSSNKKTR
ncbi:MAG: hypothetical protein L6420_07115 [Elusimicrobia bacterium]|nr:hypothetical protein [Elusimicrobiota bacterium]